MPVTRPPGQPWYSSVNLDLFVRMVNNTVLHPFICCLIPLCLRAGETPYTEPVMINTISWAIFITVFTLINMAGNRYAYGPDREIDDEEEVIVITGGSSGLGRCIAEIYAMKGASVAVLDKKGADGDAVVEGVNYYQCDVTDRAQVEARWKEINKELGLPTILINNAGIVHGRKAAELTAAEVNETFTTNTLSHYHLNQLFLPPLRDRASGGTLVTVSSVLGRLGAAQLSDYTASKAALIAMHNSISAELSGSPNVKTILVAPGQLSTEMFADVKMSRVQNFFGPVVEVSEFAMQLVKMINAGRGGILAEPFYARWIGLLECLPAGLQKLVRQWTGIDSAMQGFGKREKGENESEDSVELI